MGEKVLVLSADNWNMVDERTGQPMAGVSVWYVNKYRDDDVGSLGNKPIKIGATDDTFKVLREGGLPGVYELDYGARPGKGGKASLTLTGAKFIHAVDFFVVKNTALKAV
jgi:hypothetical protein